MEREGTMSQEVVIKSNKYGITLILDPEPDFENLLQAVADKFEDSKKFFRDAKLAVEFEGRSLTDEQRLQLLDAITAHTDITVICVVDNDELHIDQFRRQINAYYDAISGKEADFYKGNLQEGQSLESEDSIVLAGDVQAGAVIRAKGNVIVMGALCGSAFAGTDGKEDAFVAAFEMDAAEIGIADIRRGEPQPKKKARRLRRRDKTKEAEAVQPQIAIVREGSIHIEPVKKGTLY